MDLPTMRGRLRKDLRDEDAANYRWTDGDWTGTPSTQSASSRSPCPWRQRRR